MVSIIKRLMPPSIISFNESELEEIYFQLFLWNINGVSSQQLYRNLIDYGKQEKSTAIRPTKDFQQWLSEYRWRVIYNFDCTRLKLAVLELIFKRESDRSVAEKHFFMRGLPRDSAVLYGYLINDRKVWAKYKKLLQTVFSDPQVVADVITDWRVLIAQCTEDFQHYNVGKNASYIAYANLRFISESNRFETTDFTQDLLERAIAYYYMERPFKTRLHATNYAKSSLDGRKKQLIAYWTHKDRARLLLGEEVNETTVYTNRVVNMSAEMEASAIRNAFDDM